MKFLGHSLLLTVVIISLLTTASADTVWVKAGYLVDPVNGQIARDAAIRIDDDKIVSVSERQADIPSGAVIVDMSEHYVLPGLMDMHTHIPGHLDTYYFANYFQSPHRAVIGGVVNAEKTLLAGFTTVRNVGAADFQDIAIRDAIDAGEIPGPRMFVSGPSLGITGGHADNNSLNHAFAERADGVADGPWGVRQQVRKNVKYGADLIKFTATGGVFSKGTIPGQTQYSLEEMQALVDEAHTHNRKVAAHAHGTEGIKRAIEAGVDSIEHASYLDAAAIDMAIERGTWLAMDIYNTEYTTEQGIANGIPEENINKDREVGIRQRESFTMAVEAGAKMVYATDSGVYPHGDNGKQFARMVRFGMTPLQALQSATVNAAELLDREDSVGQIAAGFYADLIAVDANPLEDIAVLENIVFVMKGGEIYKQP